MGLEGWMRGRGEKDKSEERERGESGVKVERVREDLISGLRWAEREKKERDFEESGERVNTDRLWGEKDRYLISFFFFACSKIGISNTKTGEVTSRSRSAEPLSLSRVTSNDGGNYIVKVVNF